MYFSHYYFYPYKIMSDGSSWDGWMTIATFLAVIVALFGKRFWEWWGRPIVVAEFDQTSERCFRWAVCPEDTLMDQGVFHNVRRQYFRLKVLNKGLTTVRNLRAKIELYDIDKKELADRFEPTALNWIVGSSSTELAPNEYDYLNFISQVLEPAEESEYRSIAGTVERAAIKYKLRLEVADYSPRGIAWDRYIKNWKLRVIFHADNLAKPVIKFFKYTPSQGNEPGKLEETLNWE